VTARPIVSDPDMGIPDLIRRLTDDSKRLVTDEVQLAKLEAKESLHHAGRGAMWLMLAFGAGVIAVVALTILLAALIGQLDKGHMWFGALLTGIVELGLGGYLVKRGITAYAGPSYTLAETRHALTDTARWTTSAQR
jgi:Putative Actinobacterial Holin-X, holin superfamily III